MEDEMIGCRFGRLVVVSASKERRNHYICLCDCGNTKTIYKHSLCYGKTKSCGCIWRETVCKQYSIFKHPLYKLFQNMKARVEFAEDYYKSYIGVNISDELSEYESFYSFFLPTYFEGCSLDRIDSNGDYTTTNCRLVELKRQYYNKAKSSVNTSGVTGVSWFATGNSWTAYYVDHLTGKRKLKSFSANKYGEQEAFEMACEWRKTMLQYEKDNGALYGEFHGE